MAASRTWIEVLPTRVKSLARKRGGMWARRTGDVTSLGFGVLLLASGGIKLGQPYEFLSSVYQYELVGPVPGLVIAAVLPVFELVLGIVLISGRLRRGALLGVMLLMALFTFVQASALSRGLLVSCGCFGGHSGGAELEAASSGGLVTRWTAMRTWLLFLLSAAAYILASRSAKDAGPQSSDVALSQTRDGAPQAF
jgi:hypothetical protein